MTSQEVLYVRNGLGLASVLASAVYACVAAYRRGDELKRVLPKMVKCVKCQPSGQTRKLRDMIDAERVSFVRNHALLLSGALVFWIVLLLIVGNPPPAVMSGYQLICLLVHLMPWLVTPIRMDACYALNGLLWFVWGVTKPATEIPPLNVVTSQWLLAILVCNFKVTYPVSVLLTSTFMWRRYEDWVVLSSINAMMMGLLVLFELRVVHSARQKSDATHVTEQRLLRLLHALCDAVVTLGPDLKVASKAPRLASMLGSNVLSMHGTLFTDLMGESDQRRFREFLARAPDEGSGFYSLEPSQALNVHLRVGLDPGSGIQVQLLHNHFRRDYSSDQVEHLIGICEMGENTNTRAEFQDNVAANRMHSMQVASLESESRSRANLTDLESDASFMEADSASMCARRQVQDSSPQPTPVGDDEHMVATATSESEDKIGPLREHHEVTLQFDTLRFCVNQVQSASPVIDASLLESENLLNWVIDWDSSHAWIQDFVNAVLRPVNERTWSGRSPPSSVTFYVSFKGSCRLPSDILRPSPTAASPSRPSAGSECAAEESDAGSRPSTRAPPMRMKVDGVKLSRSPRRSQRGSSGSRSGSHLGSGAAGSNSPSTRLLGASEPVRGRQGHVTRGTAPQGRSRNLRGPLQEARMQMLSL